MEFSKKMLVLHIFISVVLCGITVAGTIRGWDVTAIAALTGTSFLTDGTWGGFYLWNPRTRTGPNTPSDSSVGLRISTGRTPPSGPLKSY